MKIILADHDYLASKNSVWAAKLSRWVGKCLITGETEFAMVRQELELSSSEKYLCFVHGKPNFSYWELALKQKNIDATIVRISTEGHPPRPIDAPSVRVCPYTPEEFEKSHRVRKFFEFLKDSPDDYLHFLLQTEVPRLKSLAIFLDCIAVASEEHVDCPRLAHFDMLQIIKDSSGILNSFASLTNEIKCLEASVDEPNLLRFLEHLKKFILTTECSREPVFVSGFFTAIGMDARAACNALSSILTKSL